jgi:phosphoglycerate dehydrogenase-like enzyme
VTSVSAAARPCVLVTCPVDTDLCAILDGTLGDIARLVYIATVEPDERAAVIAAADVLVCYNVVNELPPAEIDALRRVRFVQTLASGVERMPFGRLAPETLFANTAGVSARPIAEHAMAMAMACAKNLRPNHLELAAGRFRRTGFSRLMRGGVCGVIGFGAIGREVGNIARGLDMQVFAINSTGHSEAPADFVGTLDDLEFVLRRADVAVLSLSLNARTRGLIGARELAWMKPDAALINVARSQMIEEQALYEHLVANPGFGVGLDVWWIEPFTHGTFRETWPLLSLPNVIGSPHVSACITGFPADLMAAVAANVRRFLMRAEPVNLVQPPA